MLGLRVRSHAVLQRNAPAWLPWRRATVFSEANMDLQRVSGVARPLDTAYPSNVAILAATAAVLLGAWPIIALAGAGWFEALGSAAVAGLAVFLAWALARELDPDQERAAFAGAALTLPAMLLLGLPDLLGLFVVLLAIRVLNRTTGVAATSLDVVALLALGLWASLPDRPIYLATAGAALIADAVLAPYGRRRLLSGIGAAAVAAAGLIVFMPGGPGAAPGIFSALVAVALAAAFVPVVLAQRGLESVADATGEVLSIRRVRAGQLLALALALGAAFWQGPEGLAELSPLWAAMVGTAAWRFLHPTPGG
jgi:hypothetical protein